MIRQRFKRSRVELLELLTEQRAALVASCQNYDNGNHWEASRLATTIYTLVHDSGSIKSLLTQLGSRAGARFMSSGRVVDQDYGEQKLAAATPPLLMVQMTPGTTKFVARLHVTSAAPTQTQSLVQFLTWWEKELIFKDDLGDKPLTLSRRQLIFELRHRDGGSHVGDLTEPAYVRLKAGAGWFGGTSINASRGGPTAPMTETLAATMRQVAWEMMETLERLGVVQ